MSYFTKQLYSKQTGSLEFHFNGMDTLGGLKFHVSVLCDAFQHFHFAMQQCKGGGWEIVNAPQPPHWIANFENELSRAINEALAEMQMLTHH